MRHRALFVTSRAAWLGNKMLLARENVDSSLAAIVLATDAHVFQNNTYSDTGAKKVHSVRKN